MVPPLAKAMRKLRWAGTNAARALPAADQRLDQALAELDKQLRFWDGQHANFQRQQATAYLLKGAIAAAKGTSSASSSSDAKEYNRLSLGYFQKALEIDENDLQALEYVAHQHRILGEFEDAERRYSELEKLADKPGAEFSLVRMRALRFYGEMLEKQFDLTGTVVRLTEARSQLNKALQIMPEVARDEIDHAYINRDLASVLFKRNNVLLWMGYCDSAERIFLDLIHRVKDVSLATAGLEDVRKLRKTNLAAAESQNIPNGTETPSMPN